MTRFTLQTLWRQRGGKGYASRKEEPVRRVADRMESIVNGVSCSKSMREGDLVNVNAKTVKNEKINFRADQRTNGERMEKY